MTRSLSRRRFRTASARVVTGLLAVAALSSCAQVPNLTVDAARTPALPRVPVSVDGLDFAPEAFAQAAFAPYRSQALISGLALYSVQSAGVTVGTLQTAVFKPGLRSRNKSAREGVIQSLGGSPSLEVVGGQQLYALTVNQVRLIVHFSPDGQTYELLAADQQFPDPDQFLAATVTLQEGGNPAAAALTGAPPADARRGLP